MKWSLRIPWYGHWKSWTYGEFDFGNQQAVCLKIGNRSNAIRYTSKRRLIKKEILARERLKRWFASQHKSVFLIRNKLKKSNGRRI